MDPSSSPRSPILNDPETLQLLTKSLRASGAGRIHLRGNSMLPTLREGWKLHVRSLPATELRVGDIGIFVHRNLLTIHRLIWKTGKVGQERFLFQGDNNLEQEWVEAGAILGRVEAAEKERSRDGDSRPIPVGNDRRALFYRNAYRIHSFLAGLIPAVSLPVGEGSGRLPYRFLRSLFRLLEPLFSPRRPR